MARRAVVGAVQKRAGKASPIVGPSVRYGRDCSGVRYQDDGPTLALPITVGTNGEVDLSVAGLYVCGVNADHCHLRYCAPTS